MISPLLEIISSYWQTYLWTDGSQLTGLAVTMWLLILSIFFGFICSIPLAVARVSKQWWLSKPVWLYTYIFRGTPLYVQLLLIYSGLYGLAFVKGNVHLDAFFRSGFNCTILAFVLNTCAYTTEIFAGAIKATPYGEVEAAMSYGMSKFNAYRRIILPSALRRALPAYSNEVIFMLHSTPIAFTATVPDLLKVARDANAATYRSFEAFGLAALLYLVVTFSIVFLFRHAERRFLAHLAPRKAK
ncbi:ABC transporter permease [Leeia sp. TBRC 13508]|uniref:Histidine/lysine/arginine/ornithine transport system permease protein HisM n=1 Tax=Leeia speluncae TaxID=2884804 RepID=A0ABS8DA70_9NEIS|nr:ABC transporter permease [Leeia speluncae]MCB6185109.1 ABC transporter permease [Leeia speluncae]